MDAGARQEEAKIAKKQAEQDRRAAEDAKRVVAKEGGINVSEFEDAASRNHGI